MGVRRIETIPAGFHIAREVAPLRFYLNNEAGREDDVVVANQDGGVVRVDISGHRWHDMDDVVGAALKEMRMASVAGSPARAR